MKNQKKIEYKTEWDFSDIYSSPKDSKLEKDILDIENAHASFSKKFSKNDSYLVDEKKLVLAIENYTELISISDKPLWYLYKLLAVDSQNKLVSEKIGQTLSRITKAWNHSLFFTLKLGKIPKSTQKQFLTSEALKKYRYFLTLVFKTAQYDLSESEEKILNLKSRPGRGLWVDGSSKLRSNITVNFEGKELPLAEASNMVRSLPLKKRRELHNAMVLKLKENSYFAEWEMNAILTDKKIEDELRGFKNPYSATILGYQNEEKSVEALVKTVTSHFSIPQSFYKLKAKLLKLNALEYSDRAVGIGDSKRKVSIDEAIEIVDTGLSKADPEFSNIFRSMLKNGRIDIFPKKGKKGGAFCSGGINTPTIVLLNHLPDLDSVMTMAHEMGHAIHTEYSKQNLPIYQDYTISAAEVASTFFENIIFEEIFAKLSDSEKVIALHDRIQDYVSTVFRQIGCFNFELDLHTELRAKGSLSGAEIAALHNKNMSAYLGKTVVMKENDGYMFVDWGHIRNYFYVYSYAYGILISRAMYEKYKADNTYIEKVKQFMVAAGSMSPDDIFKSIGIDTSKPEFFEQGLLSIKKDIERLDKLTKKK
jgi:oligoendopeptidase F